MREWIVCTLQLLASIVIGGVIFFALNDGDPNPKVKWVTAFFGGVGGAYLLTLFWVWLTHDMPIQVGRLLHKLVSE